MSPAEEPMTACPKFQKQAALLKDIRDKIYKAEEALKLGLAGQLQEEIKELFSCLDYKKASADCKKCRCVAELRNKMANRVINREKAL